MPAGNKTGVKFIDANQNGTQDVGEPGLIGWTIYVFNTVTKALVQSMVTVAANPRRTRRRRMGSTASPWPGELHGVRGLQAGLTQTAPLAGAAAPVGETLADCAPLIANGLTLAPRGYNFTIAASRGLREQRLR